VAEPSRNGARPQKAASAADEARDVEARAAEWAADTVRSLARLVARAREEAEDIWAEAQALRQRDD
jgi:hypothetical protein